MARFFVVLDLLKSRYARDEIYTWASRTLVAINPYKYIDSYYCQQTQQQSCDFSSDEVFLIDWHAEIIYLLIKSSYLVNDLSRFC